MLLLAYGEYDSFSYWGMFWETLPFVIRMFVPALVCYVACSMLAECVRLHLIGILLFILVFLLLSTQFVVMGAYGPAHVGMEVGIWAWPGYATLLLFKVIALYMGLAPRAQPWLNNVLKSPQTLDLLCPGCGYDLRAGHNRCPECGAAASRSMDPNASEGA